MVIFDDLRWEGSAPERDSVLRQRERRADEIAYWIAALTDAATQALAGGADSSDVDQVLDRIGKAPADCGVTTGNLKTTQERRSAPSSTA